MILVLWLWYRQLEQAVKRTTDTIVHFEDPLTSLEHWLKTASLKLFLL